MMGCRYRHPMHRVFLWSCHKTLGADFELLSLMLDVGLDL